MPLDPQILWARGWSARPRVLFRKSTSSRQPRRRRRSCRRAAALELRSDVYARGERVRHTRRPGGSNGATAPAPCGISAPEGRASSSARGIATNWALTCFITAGELVADRAAAGATFAAIAGAGDQICRRWRFRACRPALLNVSVRPCHHRLLALLSTRERGI